VGYLVLIIVCGLRFAVCCLLFFCCGYSWGVYITNSWFYFHHSSSFLFFFFEMTFDVFHAFLIGRVGFSHALRFLWRDIMTQGDTRLYSYLSGKLDELWNDI